MDILLNPTNYISESTRKTACILHPHAATLWPIGFNSVDGLGNGLMDCMNTFLVHTFHLLYVN